MKTRSTRCNRPKNKHHHRHHRAKKDKLKPVSPVQPKLLLDQAQDQVLFPLQQLERRVDNRSQQALVT
jgi:hypothetical protein